MKMAASSVRPITDNVYFQSSPHAAMRHPESMKMESRLGPYNRFRDRPQANHAEAMAEMFPQSVGETGSMIAW
jgi:hypothetical protein